jgi:hypothetical protein
MQALPAYGRLVVGFLFKPGRYIELPIIILLYLGADHQNIPRNNVLVELMNAVLLYGAVLMHRICSACRFCRLSTLII